jgi:hypothetical protein
LKKQKVSLAAARAAMRWRQHGTEGIEHDRPATAVRPPQVYIILDYVKVSERSERTRRRRLSRAMSDNTYYLTWTGDGA